MSSARIPASLRSFGNRRATSPQPTKVDRTAATMITAACLAAIPVGSAMAQSSVTPLPPVNVEANQAKRKQPAKPAQAPQPAPSAAVPVLTPEQKSSNPYANPNAPYKVETSGSGKITEPIADTPKTITTIPKEVITDTAATTLRDLARQTPGVVLGFAEGGNAFGDAIYIRGFNARNDIYVNGMRDPGNSSRETFAIEQIEIYKGPGSAVSGRGTPGGALNIITKMPYEDRNFYNLSTTFGTDGQKRVTTDINQVLNPGVSVRANVLYHDSDVAGRDFAHDERWGGQFAVTVKPTSNFKFTVDYYRYRSNGIPDWGVPMNTTAKVPWTETGVDRNTWYGNANRDFIRNDLDIVTGTSEWKISPNAKVTSRTRYGETNSQYVASSPPGVTAGSTTLTVGNPQRYQDATLAGHQTDLTLKFGTFGMQHTLVTGVEFTKESIGRYSFTGLSNSLGVSLFDPNPYRPFAPVGPTSLTYKADINTRSAYVLDTVKLSDQWIINGGIRVDDYNRSQESPTAANNASRQDTLVNWHAGIVYKPIPIASFYAAYATASSPIGSELDSTGATYGGLTIGTSVLRPEETKGVEVGTKWELFNKRLLASAALFQTEKTNARENTTACDNVTLTCVAGDTGAYRVRGIELGLQGNIDKYWSVYGGFVAMETEVTSSATATNIGRRLANIPLHQFSLLSKYKVTDELTIGGQATYSGEVYSGFFAANDFGYRIPDHWRFDFLSEYKFNKNVSMQLNIVNITNELYYDALYQSAGSFVFVAPGRAGYLTLNLKY